MNVALALLTGCLAVSSGCGQGTKKPIIFNDLPDRNTVATMAGPLCEGAVCRCGDSAAAGVSELPGHKRYEFKLGPVENEFWVTVKDMVLYKSAERATECFYIDLPTGKHPVLVMAKGENGVAARVAISEIGKKGAYETFRFGCGGPGQCDFDQLDSYKKSLAKYTRNIHDPCGSTKIRELNWQHGRAPDRLHPNRLQVELTLQVYEFAPEHPSGDPACRDRY